MNVLPLKGQGQRQRHRASLFSRCATVLHVVSTVLHVVSTVLHVVSSVLHVVSSVLHVVSTVLHVVSSVGTSSLQTHVPFLHYC